MKRRTFIQVSAAAAAGCLVQSRSALAQDLPKLSTDDPMAQAMKYTHDASTVDPGTFTHPAENQDCANCALYQGDGGEWGKCQIFPGKLVAAAGWCSAWTPAS